MPVEIKELLEKQNTAFEAFKKANNERIDQIEAKGFSDPLLEEKVDKANKELGELAGQLDEIHKKMQLRGSANGDEFNQDAEDHKQAFDGFLRKGSEDGLRELEQKALNVTTDAEGGYGVTEEMDREILRLMGNDSPMRAVCTVRQVGSSTYKKLVATGGTASGWVGEAAARPETATPGLAVLTPGRGEIYANPAATQDMLDDAFFDVQSFLAEEVATEFSEQEGAAFISGNGTNRPNGILNYTSVTTGDATRTFGQLQHMVAASATAVTGDELISLVYMPKKKYRNNAVFMSNKATLSGVRKLKDSNGQYLWAPGLAASPSTLLGYNVEENEDLADMAIGAVPILFGDFRRGYIIVDRMGTRVLRDPFTNKPYVHFYTTKRVSGMVADSNAIKLLQMAAA